MVNCAISIYNIIVSLGQEKWIVPVFSRSGNFFGGGWPNGTEEKGARQSQLPIDLQRKSAPKMLDEYFDAEGNQDQASDGFNLALEEVANLLSYIDAEVGEGEGY